MCLGVAGGGGLKELLIIYFINPTQNVCLHDAIC